MKNLGVKLVLITVLLQLCLSMHEVNAGGGSSVSGSSTVREVGEVVKEADLKFGDLLVFPSGEANHYAVYVGGTDFPDFKDSNIFHMTTTEPPGCKLEKLNRPTFRRHNYLEPDIKPQTKEKMIETIKYLMKSEVCKSHDPHTRNCEQVATKVRYGQTSCKQLGTKYEIPAKFLPNPKFKRHEASAAA